MRDLQRDGSLGALSALSLITNGNAGGGGIKLLVPGGFPVSISLVVPCQVSAGIQVQQELCCPHPSYINV